MLKLVLFSLMLAGFSLASEKAAAKNCNYHGKIIPESSDYVPAPIGFCLKLKCIKAEGNTMSMLTCPTHPLPLGAHWGEKDLGKEYPDCCPKVIYS